jgi:hypothetical protein
MRTPNDLGSGGVAWRELAGGRRAWCETSPRPPVRVKMAGGFGATGLLLWEHPLQVLHLRIES